MIKIKGVIRSNEFKAYFILYTIIKQTIIIEFINNNNN